MCILSFMCLMNICICFFRVFNEDLRYLLGVFFNLFFNLDFYFRLFFVRNLKFDL